ncbi:MAG: hypothetical protein Kilf2KO_01960 [Rhodospirillales bacterium]
MHIGLPKTGSTSIQSFVFMNRQALLDRGLYYPIAFGKPSHWRLPVMVKDFPTVGAVPSIHSLAGVKTRKQQQDLEHYVVKRLMAEMAELDPRAKTILISSVQLHSLQGDEIQKLHDILKPHFDEVIVTCYLRRQDEYLASSYTTALRRGVQMPIDRWFSNERGDRLEYDTILDTWAQAFGDKCVQPRLYNPKRWLNNDLLSDFMDAIGIKDTDSLTRPPRLNESLNPKGQATLRLLNRLYPMRELRHENRGRIMLIESLNEQFPGKGQEPKHASREKMLEQSADSNERLRRKWFPKEKTVFADLGPDKNPGAQEEPEVEMEGELALVIPLLDRVSSEISSLQSRNKQLEGAIALQNGNVAAAEDSYRAAINFDSKNVSVIIDLIKLLLAEERALEAGRVLRISAEAFKTANERQARQIDNLTRKVKALKKKLRTEDEDLDEKEAPKPAPKAKPAAKPTTASKAKPAAAPRAKAAAKAK